METPTTGVAVSGVGFHDPTPLLCAYRFSRKARRLSAGR
jgi:hypothetical protein